MGFEIINMALISWESGTTYVQVQGLTSSEPPIKCYYLTITHGTGAVLILIPQLVRLSIVNYTSETAIRHFF